MAILRGASAAGRIPIWLLADSSRNAFLPARSKQPAVILVILRAL